MCEHKFWSGDGTSNLFCCNCKVIVSMDIVRQAANGGPKHTVTVMGLKEVLVASSWKDQHKAYVFLHDVLDHRM